MLEAFLHHIEAAPGGEKRRGPGLDGLLGPVRGGGGRSKCAAGEVEIEVVADVVPVICAEPAHLQCLGVDSGAREIHRNTERNLTNSTIVIAVTEDGSRPFGTG